VKESVAALGTVCLDEVRKPGRRVSSGLGGIYYTVVTLCQLAEEGCTVYPVFRIGSAGRREIMQGFGGYGCMSSALIRRFRGRNNSVVLEYYNEQDRVEYSRFLPRPFTVDELLPVPPVSLYMVNFISGREMTLSTLRALRRRLRVPLYVDLHSVFPGFRGGDGRRFPQPGRDWSRWHETGDIVQMNEAEAAVLAGKSLDRGDELRTFARHLVGKGALEVIITRGTEGAVLAWRSGRKTLTRRVAACSYGRSRDPTGCGDVFGASYVSRRVEGGTPPEAAEFAARVAAVRAMHSGSGDLHRLGRFLRKYRVR
jgi:hypothetical protein